jgi:nascent polypeptide-associated complex subunit beta
MEANGEFVPNAEKLAKLQRLAAGVRTGGKGSVRRKSKKARTALPVDDKRLQSTLKKLQLNQLPGIEEVNIVRDTNFISFMSPKVQAQISANTYVVSGTAETKPLSELMSSAMGGGGGMPGGEMAQVQAMMEQLKAAGKLPANLQPGGATAGGDDDDGGDDVPALVENSNFEEAAKADAE